MSTRRGNGEGTIYQLPDGRWRAQATIAGKRTGVYGRTRREAQQKLRQLLGAAERGLLPPAEKLTLARHVERWLEDVVRHTRKPRTYRSYSDSARLYILPALGAAKLTQLQPNHVQQLYADLLDRGLSAKTVKIVHSALHCALDQAVEWNLAPRNVAALARPPRVRRKEIEHLDAEQARRLQAVADETRWAALVAVALATGMRQGELLGLTWADVDFEQGVVRVRRQLGRDGQLAEVKNDRHRRSIDLPASTVAALREHRARQNDARLLLGPEWEHHDLVFCTHRGKPLGWRNVTREFKRLLVKAGLPDVAFHALRHTNATLLLLQGVHPKIVAERLGHSTVSMTMDVYSHVLPRMGREAAAKLDALLA